MTPVRAFHVSPPLEVIVKRHFVIGRRKDDRARDQILRWRSWEFFLRRRSFRDGDVTGRFDELLELLVGHRSLIHEESIHAHAMNRLGIVRRHRHLATAMAIHRCAHRELAARNPNHSFRSRFGRGGAIRNCRDELGGCFICLLRPG